MDDAESDEALMLRVQTGDRHAYDALYARYRERLFAFLLRRTGARAEAEEALQETWLRVHRWSGRFDAGRPFRPWVYSIATNAGRDARRAEPGLFQVEPEAGEPSDLGARVADALASLEADDRRLLLLAIEGFDGNELAVILGTTPGAVRTRLSRARARIRSAVRDA